jgi:thiol-disulfide isomerase/thioredoxin
LPPSLVAMLFISGYQTEVAAQVQRLVLATGLIRPQVSSSTPVLVAEELNLVDLDGKKAKLSDFRGKVVFLNLWATWCGPCVAEMPNIHSLYKKMSTQDIAFLMVAVSDEKSRVKRFITNKKYTFPVYMVEGRALPAAFETDGIPTTFIINPKGEIAERFIGSSEYDNEQFRQYLLKLKKKS